MEIKLVTLLGRKASLSITDYAKFGLTRISHRRGSHGVETDGVTRRDLVAHARCRVRRGDFDGGSE